MGLGKPRSLLGEFLDRHDILQERVREASSVSRDTLTRVCSDSRYVPSAKVMKAILGALRELTGKNVKADDFWPM